MSSNIIDIVSWKWVWQTDMQGFMQDQIIASNTCFGGHMDVNG